MHRKNLLALLLTFTLLIVFVIALGISQIRQYGSLAEITAKMHKHPYTVINLARSINTDIIKMHRGMKDVTLALDHAEMLTSYQLVNKLEQKVLQEFDIIHSRFSGDHTKVDYVRKRFKQWHPIRQEIYTLAKSGKIVDAAFITKNKGAKYVQSLIDNMDTFIVSANSKALDFLQSSNDIAQNEKHNLTLLLIILVSLSIILAVFVTLHISTLFKTIHHKNKLLKESNDALKLQTSELDQAQSIAHIGSWRLDHIHKTLHWSDETYTIFNLKTQERPLDHKDFSSYIHPDDRDRVQQLLTKAEEDKQPYQMNYRLLFDDKSIKFVHERCKTVYTPQGTKLISIGTFQDVTKEVKDKEIQMAQSRLAQMGEMLTMIAHQWRQPLTSISVIASDIKMRILLENFSIDMVEKKVDNILNHTEHLSDTIQNFQNFFKPSHKATPFILCDAIDESLALFDGFFTSNSIEIVKECSTQEKITNYKNEIIQVFLNIYSNAIDAISEVVPYEGVITIKHSQEADHQVITIADNAGGIKSENLERIFEPYFSTKSKNATGIGLYMSKVMIEDHCQGVLSVVNQDKGACFKLSFPKTVES